MLRKELASGRVRLDIAGRGDVIGGHAVAQERQAARSSDRRDGAHLHRHSLKIWGILDVRALGIPRIHLA